MFRRILISFALTVMTALLFSIFSCSGGGSYDGGSYVTAGSPAAGSHTTCGATPGGAQDIGYVRTLIEAGQVPDEDLFHVEGIFSEYDLPLDGPPPNHVLTVNTSHGYAADGGISEGGLYVQVGFSSSVDAENFTRDPLNLSVVVDKSGSMGGYKIAAVRDALMSLVDRLNDDDLLSIVLFSHELDVLLAPTPVNDPGRIKSLISSIAATGSTNMDVGLRKGYELVRENLNRDGRSDRVMLFTDAMPNTGDYSSSNFHAIVGAGTEDEIGLTAFGVGLDFNQELIDFIAVQRGGNYFYLQGEDEIAEIFNEDFDFMVTPIAYDLRLTVEKTDEFTFSHTYGFPGSNGGEITLEVATIFLSRSRGAVLLKFEPRPGAAPLVPHDARIASLKMKYYDASGAEHNINDNVLYTGAEVVDTSTHYFAQDNVRKTVALAREMITMKEACRVYHLGCVTEAVETLNNLVAYLEQEIAALGATEMEKEVDLVEKLIRNMSN